MITLAICTWNRAAMLDRLLGSLAKLAIPSDCEWEVLVVDNNCTDDTQAVLKRHEATLPLRAVREPQQGIAHARNQALAEARGDYILWTDDDLAVPADWLANFRRAAEQFPDAGMFGGPIRAWFADELPPRLRRFAEENLHHLSPMFGMIDFGPDVRELQAGEFFFAGNMMLRTEAARRFHFDSRFGRVGRHGLLGGEETLFMQQMLDDGEQGVWVGNAPARHYIPAERLAPRYIWNYFAALGRTQGRIDGIPSCPTLFGRPRWALVQSLRHRAAALAARQVGQPWLENYLHAAKLDGYLAECAAHRHGRRPGYLVPPHRNPVATAS